MEHVRLGLVIRALRRRRGWRQRDLARAAGVHQSDVSEMERGQIGEYRVEVVQRVFAALEARCDLEPRWRGGALDRLIDERHAALAGQGSVLLAVLGWHVLPEVTYSEFGERGSIDLFAARPDHAAVCVAEIKSELVSIEATLRSVDAKVRLAPKLAEQHFGWRPRTVGRLLVLPESSTERRRVARAAALVDTTFPLRGRDARHWLANPLPPDDRRPVGGILFLPPIADRNAKRVRVGAQRVRLPPAGAAIASGDG